MSSVIHFLQHFSRNDYVYDALEEHVEMVSTGGRTVTNLQFADDINALAEEEQLKVSTKLHNV